MKGLTILTWLKVKGENMRRKDREITDFNEITLTKLGGNFVEILKMERYLRK